MGQTRVASVPVLAVLLCALVGATSPALAARSGQPDAGHAAPEVGEATAALVTATMVVDGVIDAAYGAPIAADGAGDGNGNANLDLLALYAGHDTNYLYVAFTVNADLAATNWGKYVLYVDTTNDASGATSDAWGRNVVVDNPHKPEYAVYTWLDSTPYGPEDTQLLGWTGAAWDWGNVGQVAACAIGAGAQSVVEWQIAKADLGNPDTLRIEVWDTGGGGADNAQDTINAPAEDWNATDWSTQSALDNSTLLDLAPAEIAAIPALDLTGLALLTALLGAAAALLLRRTG